MTTKTPKLYETLAVIQDTQNAANAILEETLVTFTKKPDHFRGQVRTLTYYDEARQVENEHDEKGMVTTVGDKLDYTMKSVARHWDALFQLEEGNQRAKADLVVGGQVLVADAPATWLLGMEGRLKQFKNCLMMTPTLDPALIWTPDPDAGQGVYRSNAQQSKKTEKVIKHRVLYDATKEHPAQIERWSDDVAVGSYETTHTSGMISPADKSAMLDRTDRLIRAVKKARQRANEVEVQSANPADALLGYIANTATK